MKLNYSIEFVADMDRAVKFYRDVLGLPLKFQSTGWSEFSTGETSLGLQHQQPGPLTEIRAASPLRVEVHHA